MSAIGMHYGFWSHNWDEIQYVPLMEKVARLGFDVCEVASAEFCKYSDETLGELKRRADDLGLTFTYSIGLEKEYDLASDDPAVRDNGVRHVTEILKSMPKVGAAILNGVSYAGWQAMPDHGITLEEKRRKEELALDSMRRLMPVAEDCGVYYCCEVVNRFEQYLLNTAREGAAFVKQLESPNAKVLLDTFHMNIEEDDLLQAILETGDLLGHFHVGERLALEASNLCTIFFFLVFGDRVSLYSPGCPGSHFVDQAGLKLRNPPASASQVLGLKVRATMPG